MPPSPEGGASGHHETAGMYLTSFIHRKELFGIVERWLCGRPEPGDIRSLTGILICDGFVINETLQKLAERLLGIVHRGPFIRRRIYTKGELRDHLCRGERSPGPRVAELFRVYREKPDFFYRETPINATLYLDAGERLLGAFRIKRPKRIAEKANRRIADWIFENVLAKAREMARERARLSGVPLERFVTPAEEMTKEFIRAEEFIAEGLRDGSIRLYRDAMTIQDVGAMKIIAGKEELRHLEKEIGRSPDISLVERADFSGSYQATNLVLEVPWDAGQVCRRYRDDRAWERYRNRGIPDEDLRKGLEPLLSGAGPRVNVEVILTTFPDMVESELGASIHEERIIAQRNDRRYLGYIPMNVEFLVEALFALGFSPRTDSGEVPIKLWGRYLPETMSMYVRRLHNLPEYDLIT